MSPRICLGLFVCPLAGPGLLRRTAETLLRTCGGTGRIDALCTIAYETTCGTRQTFCRKDGWAAAEWEGSEDCSIKSRPPPLLRLPSCLTSPRVRAAVQFYCDATPSAPPFYLPPSSTRARLDRRPSLADATQLSPLRRHNFCASSIPHPPPCARPWLRRPSPPPLHIFPPVTKSN